MARNLSIRQTLFAYGLTATAGFVDGLAFIHLGGFFVSFMTGNTTRAGVGIAGGHLGEWATAAWLLASFVAGVMLSSAVSKMRRVPSSAIDVSAVWVCFGLMLTAGFLSLWVPELLVTSAFIAASMGAVNGTFTRDGEVSVGLTYMTGTLVKIGQSFVTALVQRQRWYTLQFLRYCFLWGSLAVGAVAGAFAYLWLNIAALWIAVAALAVTFLVVSYYKSRRAKIM